MSKVGTAHVEVKAVVNEESLKGVSDAIGTVVDGALCVTSASLIAAAVRLHDAMYQNAEALGLLDDTCPVSVVTAYGDIQGALTRLGMTY